MSDELMAIFSSIGVLNSLFFAIYLWFQKKNNVKSNKLLAMLLLAFSFRISKSVLFYYFRNEMSLYVITLGLSGMVCIGPLIYLYFISILNKEFKFKRNYFLHFLPFLIVVLLNTYLMKIQFSFRFRHGFMLLQYLVYIILSLSKIYRYRQKLKESLIRIDFKWMYSINWVIFRYLFNLTKCRICKHH